APAPCEPRQPPAPPPPRRCASASAGRRSAARRRSGWQSSRGPPCRHPSGWRYPCPGVAPYRRPLAAPLSYLWWSAPCRHALTQCLTKRPGTPAAPPSGAGGAELAHLGKGRGVAGDAAVHEQLLAGDEAGLVGGEEHRRRRDIGGLAEEGRQVVVRHDGTQRLGKGLGGGLGEDHADHQDIGPHPLLAVLGGDVL